MVSRWVDPQIREVLSVTESEFDGGGGSDKGFSDSMVG
jgi:hypothetical protein